MLKRLLLVGLLFSLALPSFSVPAHANWAAPYMELVAQKQIMQRDETGQLHAYDNVTRAQASEMLVRALQIPLNAQMQIQAQDLPAEHPQASAMHKLIELGVLDDAAFVCPDALVTRAQIAKMLARAFDIEVDGKNKSTFSDVAAGYWAKDYIESLADIGIFEGKEQAFLPYAKLKKGQLAKMLVNAMHFKEQVEQLEVAYDYLGKCYIMTPKQNEAWVEETIQLVNSYRQEQNIAPLRMNPKLNQIATIKAQDLIARRYFEHYSPYYGNPWDLATLYDFSFQLFGENLARYLTSPEEAVKAWLASEVHRENMLKHNYSDTGVAIVADDAGRYYWVQLFSNDK